MILELRQVSKTFGSNRAVDDVSLHIDAGQIVGLIGENGAGKSTLMRIAAAETTADDGQVIMPGRVGMVHQHFALIAQFTISENLALAGQRHFQLHSPASLRRGAEQTIRATGIDLTSVGRLVSEISVGERAKLELIKAVASHPDLLILDEPTSVLAPLESAELFRLMRRLAGDGKAVVFITHKIAEVLAVAGRLIVMRRGRVVADTETGGMTPHQIAAAMVGRSGVDEDIPPPTRSREATAGIALVADPPVFRGEIVAVVGVAGNGQRELADALRGPQTGFIPEDRLGALIGTMSIAENIALRAGREGAVQRAVRLIEQYRIAAQGPHQPAGQLSGGNQQKVILARELDRNPELLIAAEPTRGLDIESTRFVREQLRLAARRGAAVLLITSDLDEAFELADGIHVIYRGRLSPRMTSREAEPRVAALMAGVA